LTVAWADNDPDDNALISIYLDPDDGSFNGNEFPIALDIEEDADEDGDSAEIAVTDVPPGAYRVIGLITDGTASVAAVAPGGVTVTAVTPNEPPTVELTEPGAYRALAVISDGKLLGFARAAGVVTVE